MGGPSEPRSHPAARTRRTRRVLDVTVSALREESPHPGDEPLPTSPDAPFVTIVLPCYNEQDHVMLELERITTAMDASGYTYELLCIDDKSTDNTLQVLREAQHLYPRMRLLAFRSKGRGGPPPR